VFLPNFDKLERELRNASKIGIDKSSQRPADIAVMPGLKAVAGYVLVAVGIRKRPAEIPCVLHQPARSRRIGEIIVDGVKVYGGAKLVFAVAGTR